jgi:hypothetical protein
MGMVSAVTAFGDHQIAIGASGPESAIFFVETGARPGNAHL